MIILPDDKIVVPHQLAGFYKIEAIRPDGSRRLLADWFPNLITDNGLNLIGTGASWLSTCVVGSGNNTPANSDTALQTLVGTTTNVLITTNTAQSSAPYYGSTTKTYRFAAGVATGNLAEVGVGSTSTSLFSRALILDGVGSPTTITVLSTEALDVTYQIRNYAPASDVTGSITIQSVTYNYTVRASNANSTAWAPQVASKGGIATATAYNGAIGAVTGTPAGTSDGATSVVNAAYSSGSYQTDATVVWGLTNGNLAGGITAFRILFDPVYNGLGAIQVGLNIAIPKDGTKVLTLGFRHSWGRYP